MCDTDGSVCGNLERDTLYKVLGVGQLASRSEIRTAYLKRALQHHPDKGGTADDFKLVVFAFETLYSGNARDAYDRKLQRLCKTTNQRR